MKRFSILAFCLAILFGCTAPGVIAGNDTVRATIIGTTAQPDPVEQQIRQFEKDGQLKVLRVMESFPLQFEVEGSKIIIEQLQALSRKPPKPDHAATAKALKAAQTQWSRNGLAAYTYTLQHTCFCPPEYTQPLKLHIINGDVVGAILASGQPLPAKRSGEAKTVEDLFAVIQDAIQRNAASITAKYDPHYGYPTSISIDYDRMMADEETYYTASNMRPANGGIVPPPKFPQHSSKPTRLAYAD